MDSLRQTVESSLRLLARECPWHWKQLERLLAGQSLNVWIAPEHFALVCDPCELRVGDTVEHPTARFRCDRPALLPLLHGEKSALNALERGEVDMRAPVNVLLILADAFAIYLAGALRSPSHFALLHQLKGTGQ